MKILRTVYCWKNNGNKTEQVQKPVLLDLPLPTELHAREIAKQKREAVRLVDELDILDSGKYYEEDRIAKAFE